MNLTDAIHEFRKAMLDHGVPFNGHIEADAGKITRFTVEGDRKQSLTGWYIIHSDGVPAGEFGCWKRGVQATWCAKSPSDMSEDERRLIQERVEQNKRMREKQQAETHAAAAETALMMWDAADPCDSHPYLTRKNVPSHGLRVGKWVREFPDRTVTIENALLIPIRDGKKIVSLQAVFADKQNTLGRDKDFLPGGKKRGCFLTIGRPTAGDSSPVVVICEGYSTGASIHEATGHAVIVAFDAGNLNAVTERIRAKMPTATIIIAADNDRWTLQPVENPGVHYAKAAADRHRCWLAVPEFDDLDTKPTDFNDLAALQGFEEVADQIEASVRSRVIEHDAPPAPAANDNTPAPAPADRKFIDYMTPLRDVNGTGKPLSTIENMAEMCDRLGVTIRYNVITKEEEILFPGEAFSVDNQANASLAMLMSWCGRFRMPVGQISDFVTYLADKNPYNPVANWISSRPWDGVTRLPALYATVTAAGESQSSEPRIIKEFLLRRWLVSAVAGAFRPNGVSAHGVLVFQGAQYLGKTMWFKRLVPAELGVLSDGLILKPDDRDSVKQAVSNWLVELGELDATFRKSDIAQLKSFLTKDRDVLRRAYARRESTYARRTVFFGSVNPNEFLHDMTGNRRYWTIACEALDLHHNIDMQQLWAEVKALLDAGESWFLTPDEMAMLNDGNKKFEVIDPIQERLSSGLCWDDAQSLWVWKSATDVLIDIGIDRPTQSDSTRAATILRSMNGNTSKRTATSRLLLVPRKKIRAYGS